MFLKILELLLKEKHGIRKSGTHSYYKERVLSREVILNQEPGGTGPPYTCPLWFKFH